MTCTSSCIAICSSMMSQHAALPYPLKLFFKYKMSEAINNRIQATLQERKEVRNLCK